MHLYDIKNHSSFCYTPPNESDHHTGPVSCVGYNDDGSMFTTCSKDGTIKIWDGVTNRCIHTMKKAHSGQEVFHVQFAPRSTNIVLSSGKDSVSRLWDVDTGEEVRQFRGGLTTKKRTNSCFSHKATDPSSPPCP